MIDGIAGATSLIGDMTYQVGDRVRFLDMKGVVIATSEMFWHRYITVKMDAGPELLFEKDGRYFAGSDYKLGVIGRVKPKVKRYRYAYRMPTSREWTISELMHSEEEAQYLLHGLSPQRIDASMEESDA